MRSIYKYSSLSEDIINIISKYTLPLKENIKKVIIDNNLNSGYIINVKYCINDNVVYYDNGMKSKKRGNGYFFKKRILNSYWTLRERKLN